MWGFLLPLAWTPGKRNQRLLVRLLKGTGDVGKTKLPKFQNGGRWTRTTVISTYSPVLYRRVTAPQAILPLTLCDNAGPDGLTAVASSVCPSASSFGPPRPTCHRRIQPLTLWHCSAATRACPGGRLVATM